MTRQKLLSRVKGPESIRMMPLTDLTALAEEMRGVIKETVSSNSGHLASNLGTVELTIALHYCFDFQSDRIIWDVGNQCYAHKILTGRRRLFRTIRTTAGLSGFVNHRESPHDHMTAGHAGTALSAALGIARARDYVGDDYRVVAVVGDGGMSAGLSYEALNDLGAHPVKIFP